MDRRDVFNADGGTGPCRGRLKGALSAGNGGSSGLFDRERHPKAGELISSATPARVYTSPVRQRSLSRFRQLLAARVPRETGTAISAWRDALGTTAVTKNTTATFSM